MKLSLPTKIRVFITIPATILTLTSCISNHQDSNNVLHTAVTQNNHIKCEHSGFVLDVMNVRVIDGDTLEVITPNGQSERIRLFGIDAPESKQSHGAYSTEKLQECVNNTNVSIEWKERDFYKRVIGKVVADGKDCNLNQLQQGAAWHYKSYQKNQIEYDRLAYSNAEVNARTESRGLWAKLDVVAPWDYRKRLNKNYEFNSTLYDLENASCNNDGIITDNNLVID